MVYPSRFPLDVTMATMNDEISKKSPHPIVNFKGEGHMNINHASKEHKSCK